jgi:plastocyanin
LRKRYLPLAAALGTAVAVIPATISGFASEPTISAIEESGYYGGTGTFAWSPTSAQIAPGGTVAFQNMSTTVPHGIKWTGGPATPSCSSGVPIGENKGIANWKGTCTFNTAGEYTFVCSVHANMTGRIFVGTVTTSSSTSSPPTTTTTTSTKPYEYPYESSTSSSTSASYTPPGTSPPVSYPGFSPPASATSGSSGNITPSRSSTSYPSEEEGGSPAGGLVIASSQHGGSVHGSVKISKSGAGGRLQVELLATSASLAKAKKHKHASSVSVGRMVRSGLRAGKVSFSVALSSKAKSAMRRHHRLAMTVKITVTPTHGEALSMSRSVTARG